MKTPSLSHLLTNLGFTLLRLVTYLPNRFQTYIGYAFGVLIFLTGRRWKRAAATNIANVFPSLSKNEQKALIKQNFRSLGVAAIEMAHAWWGNNKKLRQHVTVEGLEHIDHALKHGKGVILLSAHFTTLEIGGKLLSMFRPLHAMYRPQNSEAFNKIMVRGRLTFLESLIERTDLRGMLKALKNNQIIWYAMDQDSSGKNSVFVDFFNIKCSSTTATSKLAKASGAAVIPFSTYRLSAEGNYKLVIHAPLEDFPSDNLQADTQQIMNHFEQQIRKAPEQYLWIHRRFKSQPEGYPQFYSDIPL